MRELRSKNRFLSRPIILFIALIVVSVFVYENELLDTGSLLGFIVIFTLFNYITSYNLFYNFKIADSNLEISNLWNPLISKKILLEEIVQIESKVANQIGLAILIKTSDGKKRFYGVQAKKEEIEEMISYIRSAIKANGGGYS